MSGHLQRPLKEVRPLFRSGSNRSQTLRPAPPRIKSRSCSPRPAVHSRIGKRWRSPQNSNNAAYGQYLAAPFRTSISKTPPTSSLWKYSPSPGCSYVLSPGSELRKSSGKNEAQSLEITPDTDRLNIASAVEYLTPVSNGLLLDSYFQQAPYCNAKRKSGRNKRSISPIPFVCTEDENSEGFEEESPQVDSLFRKSLLEMVIAGDSSSKHAKHFRLLGKGTFGQVVFGQFKDARFAVKVTVAARCPHMGESNAKTLLHPNIVRTLGVYSYPSRYLVIMEYGGEKNLQQLLDDPEEFVSKFRRNSFALQIAKGLSHCHQNHVVHLDVKPSNVMVSSRETCKLCDFGSSVYLVQNELCICRTIDYWKSCVPGTVAYIAPELFRGSVPTMKADIYSFGVTLWQLMTRQRPYENEEPHSIIYKVVSKRLRPGFTTSSEKNYVRITKACWEDDMKQRPSSDALVCLFANWLSSLLLTSRIGKEKQ